MPRADDCRSNVRRCEDAILYSRQCGSCMQEAGFVGDNESTLTCIEVLSVGAVASQIQSVSAVASCVC